MTKSDTTERINEFEDPYPTGTSPIEFLQKESEKYPEYKESYDEFSQLHKLKKWHQLTEKLLDFVKKDTSYKIY